MRFSAMWGKQKYLLAVTFLCLFFAVTSHAATNVSGNITTDTTWTLANSPYIVTGTVQVLEGVTLTIQPGVTVKFNKDTLLRIGGELIAEGTASRMTTFTSNEPTPAAGDWGPIEFVEGAVGSTLDENGEFVSGSVVKYCRIDIGLGLSSDVNLYVSDCFFNGSGMGVGNGTFTIKSNTFNNAGIWAEQAESIFVRDNILNSGGVNLDGIIKTATVSGNYLSGTIRVQGWGWGTFNIEGNTVFNGCGIGCGGGTCNINHNQILDNSSANSGGGITIWDGNFGINANIVSGNMAYGEAVGCWPTPPPPGRGGGISASGTGIITNNVISNNKARAGWSDGEAGGIGGAIYIYASGSITVLNNNITNNTGESANNPTDTSSIIYCENAFEGSCSITNNNIEGNSGHFIIANQSSMDITAINNWWGTTNISEIGVKIYDYYDDIRLGKVIYQPIAQAPFPMTGTVPTAAFIATPLSGNAPLTVSFTDQSTNSPLSWSWSFGDGGTSSEQNPSHTYNGAGTYTVTLTVSNTAGADTETKNGCIAVSSSGTGTVAGVVRDAFTGIGIGGATVSVAPGNYRTVTIASTPFGQIGAYIISGIPAGTYSVSLSAPGYNTATQSQVVVNTGTTTTLNLSLTPLYVENEIKFSIDPACGAAGSPITISAPSNVGGHFFKYFVNTVSYCGTTTPSWQLIQDWTTERSITYTPSRAGRDTFVVWVTDDITESCPQLMGASYGVGEADCIDAVEVSLSPASGVVNEPVTIQAVGAANDLKYSFWVNETNYDCRNPIFQNWVLLKDWSSSNSYTYTPTEEKVYTFVVWTAKDTNNACYGMGGMTYKVSAYTGGGEGYWSFNEQSSLVAYDSSGYGNDGVIYGAIRVSGICGGALQFDGVDDYVEVPDRSSLDMANGITIEAWIRTDEIPSSGVKTIASKDENGEFHVYQDGKITAWLKNSSDTIFNVFGRTVLSTGTWYYVAMTCEKDRNLKVYVNGNEDGGIPFAGNLMTNNDPFQIGQDQGYPGRFFKGTIDEVHIYNRALSQAEIQNDMECGTGNLTGLVRDAITGRVIENATVSVIPGNYSAVTELNTVFSSGGKYEIWNIPVGTYAVIASKAGYVSKSQSNVVISAEGTTTVNITVTPQ